MARRCLAGALTVLLVSLLVFLLTRVLGDPATAVLGPTARQPEALAAKRAELGLDRSLAAQFLGWWGDALTGDLGESFVHGRPIRSDMLARVTNSLVLMGCGALLAVPLSIVVGTRAAVRRDHLFDHVTNVVTLVLLAVPEFLVATALVLGFSVGVFELLPATSSVRGDVRPWDDVSGMVLPSVAMALLAAPYVARTMRASMMEELDSDYTVAARLNGLSAHHVVWRQAWPNALAPTLQVVALSLAYMVGGAVIIEFVFNYPGVGSALVEAIKAHDVPVVQFVATFAAAVYVALNIAADVATVLLTPRLRTRVS